MQGDIPNTLKLGVPELVNWWYQKSNANKHIKQAMAAQFYHQIINFVIQFNHNHATHVIHILGTN